MAIRVSRGHPGLPISADVEVTRAVERASEPEAVADHAQAVVGRSRGVCAGVNLRSVAEVLPVVIDKIDVGIR